MLAQSWMSLGNLVCEVMQNRALQMQLRKHDSTAFEQSMRKVSADPPLPKLGRRTSSGGDSVSGGRRGSKPSIAELAPASAPAAPTETPASARGKEPEALAGARPRTGEAAPTEHYSWKNAVWQFENALECYVEAFGENHPKVAPRCALPELRRALLSRPLPPPLPSSRLSLSRFAPLPLAFAQQGGQRARGSGARAHRDVEAARGEGAADRADEPRAGVA